eukprot:gene11930-8210_t
MYFYDFIIYRSTIITMYRCHCYHSHVHSGFRYFFAHKLVWDTNKSKYLELPAPNNTIIFRMAPLFFPGSPCVGPLESARGPLAFFLPPWPLKAKNPTPLWHGAGAKDAASFRKGAWRKKECVLFHSEKRTETNIAIKEVKSNHSKILQLQSQILCLGPPLSFLPFLNIYIYIYIYDHKSSTNSNKNHKSNSNTSKNTISLTVTLNTSCVMGGVRRPEGNDLSIALNFDLLIYPIVCNLMLNNRRFKEETDKQINKAEQIYYCNSSCCLSFIANFILFTPCVPFQHSPPEKKMSPIPLLVRFLAGVTVSIYFSQPAVYKTMFRCSLLGACCGGILFYSGIIPRQTIKARLLPSVVEKAQYSTVTIENVAKEEISPWDKKARYFRKFWVCELVPYLHLKENVLSSKFIASQDPEKGFTFCAFGEQTFIPCLQLLLERSFSTVYAFELSNSDIKRAREAEEKAKKSNPELFESKRAHWFDKNRVGDYQILNREKAKIFFINLHCLPQEVSSGILKYIKDCLDAHTVILTEKISEMQASTTTLDEKILYPILKADRISLLLKNTHMSVLFTRDDEQELEKLRLLSTTKDELSANEKIRLDELENRYACFICEGQKYLVEKARNSYFGNYFTEKTGKIFLILYKICQFIRLTFPIVSLPAIPNSRSSRSKVFLVFSLVLSLINIYMSFDLQLGAEEIDYKEAYSVAYRLIILKNCKTFVSILMTAFMQALASTLMIPLFSSLSLSLVASMSNELLLSATKSFIFWSLSLDVGLKFLFLFNIALTAFRAANDCLEIDVLLHDFPFFFLIISSFFFCYLCSFLSLLVY